MSKKKRNAQAVAEWQYFNGEKFEGYGETPEVLDANISNKRVSVWLPRGQRLVFRLGIDPTFPIRRTHVYGRAGDRKRIVFLIAPELYA